MKLMFQRHYFEQDLTFEIEMADLLEHGKVTYEMVFGAGDTGNWEIVIKHGADGDVIGVVENMTQGEKIESKNTPVVVQKTSVGNSRVSAAAAVKR
jgi:hypothetical protein